MKKLKNIGSNENEAVSNDTLTVKKAVGGSWYLEDQDIRNLEWMSRTPPRLTSHGDSYQPVYPACSLAVITDDDDPFAAAESMSTLIFIKPSLSHALSNVYTQSDTRTFPEVSF